LTARRGERSVAGRAGPRPSPDTIAADGSEAPLDAADASAVARFKARLLAWYAEARRDLPWRRTRDPYRVWVSETMLQQTRVETVVPYYERFLREFPTVGALAEAPEERVLSLWSGLGYYRRARMLHAAAKQVAAGPGGSVPSDAQGLRALPGVGAYTAGAIASIAFGRPAALVDGNVARVLARLFAIEEDVTGEARARVWSLAEALVTHPAGEPGDFNQALMELGATTCVPRNPRCDACPVRAQCGGLAAGIAADLPLKKAKRPPVPVQWTAIVLASETRVLLARRRPDVLFGGLWEPPGTTSATPAVAGGAAPDDRVDALAGRLGCDRAELEPAGQVVHVLSHRLLQVEVLCGPLREGARRKRRIVPPNDDYDAVEAVAWSDVDERPHASLTTKILKVAKRGPRGVPYEIK
jgi:A/G-specific adenine glycosylase